MLATAAGALLLTPVAWVARERRQLLQAQHAILAARETALRSAVREEQRRLRQTKSPPGETSPPAPSGPSLALPGVEKLPADDQLRDENVHLRRQVEQLRREVERLKHAAAPPGNPKR